MVKKKLFVFDIDDTLSQTAKLHQAAFVVALQKMGVEEIDTNFGDYQHHTDSFIAKVIYEEDRQEAFTLEKLNQFHQLLTEEVMKYSIQEIKGAKQKLAEIEMESEFGICYATGSLLKPAQYKLDEIGIKDYQNRLTASDQLFEREQIVSSAIEKAKKYYRQDNFEQIISVGDGLWDLKAANQLAIHFVGMGDRNQRVLTESGAKVVYSDFSSFDLDSVDSLFL